MNYTSLWLNDKGFRKALTAHEVDIDPRLLFYPSEAFAQSNNNCSSAEMREKQRDWVRLYKEEGYTVDAAYVMTAFGCNFEGPISQERILGRFPVYPRALRGGTDPCANPCRRGYNGVGKPRSRKRKRMIGALRELAPDARIGMHIHDTRGLGIANLHAALSMGVDMFESSVAGLGGCPFAGHGHARAAGNVCTEDAVFLCHELGIETGIDLDKLIAAALKAEEIIEAPLMGRVMHTGGLDKYRKTS